MTNQIIKQLREVGLKQNEAEIYIFLLQNGLSTPPQIAKGTNIARTNCYNILKSLEEKDVVEMIQKGKREAFLARDPESLKFNLERKLESVERLLPDLRASYVVQKNKPTFQFFEGWVEVKRIYELSLDTKDVYALGSTERLDTLDHEFFEDYTKKCEKNQIFFHDILTADSQGSGQMIKNIRGEAHQIRFLPEKYSNNITDILIWGDNLGLISLEEPIFGTIITSKPLSDTFKTILAFVRDYLPSQIG